MKKVLLLTASYGTGHITASKWLEKSLIDLYKEDIVTEIIDFINLKEKCYSTNFFQKIYNTSMEYPVLWDIFFRLSDNKLINFYFNLILPTFYSSFYKIFNKFSPDIFVTTHPYWNFIINSYRKHYKKNIKCVCIITDSTMIHHSWISSVVDYYIVCDLDTKEKIIKKFKIEKDKILPFGFPVNSELGKEFLNKNYFINSLGLEENILTVLIVIGLGNTERFIEILNFLNTNKSNKFQVIVITGKYKKIYNQLINIKYNIPVKIIGWTDRMHDFIRISDLVISKGGGAIIGETMAANKPVLIPVFVPGQERGNVLFIKKHNLGFQTDSLEEAKKILLFLISDPLILKKYQQHLKQFNKHDAAINIAKFIYSII